MFELGFRDVFLVSGPDFEELLNDEELDEDEEEEVDDGDLIEFARFLFFVDDSLRLDALDKVRELVFDPVVLFAFFLASPLDDEDDDLLRDLADRRELDELLVRLEYSESVS